MGLRRGGWEGAWGVRGREASANVPPIARDDSTVFFLSPANLNGRRGNALLEPTTSSALADALRSSHGARIGEVFAFVSGLYFQGKMTYAEAFGRAPEGNACSFVISPAEGMCPLGERVTLARLRSWAGVPIDAADPRFRLPLVAHVTALASACPPHTRFVLLGSIASDKYVSPLLSVLGERLLFPSDFVGRGDKSRGALLLQAARAGLELPYVPVAGACRHGKRPPSIAKRPPRARDARPR